MLHHCWFTKCNASSCAQCAHANAFCGSSCLHKSCYATDIYHSVVLTWFLHTWSVQDIPLHTVQCIHEMWKLYTNNFKLECYLTTEEDELVGNAKQYFLDIVRVQYLTIGECLSAGLWQQWLPSYVNNGYHRWSRFACKTPSIGLCEHFALLSNLPYGNHEIRHVPSDLHVANHPEVDV